MTDANGREVQTFFKEPKPPKKTDGQRLRRKRKPHSQPRPVEPWSTDADYVAACGIVDRRAKGCCEHCGTPGATNHHHLAGRGFAGCHHPLLIKLLCGNGNVDGCHRVAHSVSVPTGSALGLRLPWGTTADDLRGVS